ncbi:hypothetical protein BD410DRAFT_785348 [Rickenella mellea]|uniref:Xylanolytic transcriptional activator regulatory domain-containing protein n=1 Tax=Rickenella mellea TaxID=50990 RepID=A0A4Y7QCL1_9AGAM|nr:hypothetical protein BD410DRAFT_785348 [Rickenella mellea]
MHLILHAPTSSPLPRSAHYSPFLHNAMLAVASAFSDEEGVRGEGGRIFAERARGYVEGECERPSLGAVQALAMLASYYSGMGQQTIGFMYFGMSTRIGQALGLGSDHTQWIKAGFVTTQDIFDRRWCYQMTCAQDACWSLYVGRDFATSLHGADKDLLAHPFAQALDNEPFQHPFPSSRSSSHSSTTGNGRGGRGDEITGQPGFIMTTFVASCELMMISRRVMGIIAELTSWKLTLPAPLELTPENEGTATPHKLMLHIAWWWLVILLHRPFCGTKTKAKANLETRDDVVSSFDRCTKAADEIMRLVLVWRDSYTLRVTPITFAQAMFCAGTVYLLNSYSVQRPSPHPSPHSQQYPNQGQGQDQGRDPSQDEWQERTTGKAKARENVKVLIGLLKEAAESWGCARKMAEIFESLVTEREKEKEKGERRGGGMGKGKGTSRRTRRGPGDGSGVHDVQGMGSGGASSGSSAQTPSGSDPADAYASHPTFNVSPTHPHPMPQMAFVTPDPFAFPPSDTFISFPSASASTSTSTPTTTTSDHPMDISSEPPWPLPLDPSLLDLFPWYSSIGLGMLDGDTLSSQPNLLDPQAAEMLLSSQMGYFNQGMY